MQYVKMINEQKLVEDDSECRREDGAIRWLIANSTLRFIKGFFTNLLKALIFQEYLIHWAPSYGEWSAEPRLLRGKGHRWQATANNKSAGVVGISRKKLQNPINQCENGGVRSEAVHIGDQALECTTCRGEDLKVISCRKTSARH